mmetsp:Transcript_40600/g.130510  ORF Transcript_40600/g.130510 Transcript_40600/m.130510 type:complete len:206 (+) Transcript_40600:789-1406(+)
MPSRRGSFRWCSRASRLRSTTRRSCACSTPLSCGTTRASRPACPHIRTRTPSRSRSPSTTGPSTRAAARPLSVCGPSARRPAPTLSGRCSTQMRAAASLSRASCDTGATSSRRGGGTSSRSSSTPTTTASPAVSGPATCSAISVSPRRLATGCSRDTRRRSSTSGAAAGWSEVELSASPPRGVVSSEKSAFVTSVFVFTSLDHGS